jgi:hypothetical protein
MVLGLALRLARMAGERGIVRAVFNSRNVRTQSSFINSLTNIARGRTVSFGFEKGGNA